MNTVDFKNVSLTSGFLHEKQELNKRVTIDAVYNRFYETGRVEAFACNWKEGDEPKPHCFWDSDVAKWIEGAAYVLQKQPDPSLEAKIEHIIDMIEENQEKDGYFNIYYIVCEPGKRFTNRDMHELYCAGHLFEAAVAYYEATGKERFLKLMERYADCIYEVFVNKKTALFATPGHEEIELALVRMYRATKKRKYLELAAFFINNRGTESEKNPVGQGTFNDESNQSHLPVRLQKTAVGHSVRACYLYSAMADLAYETKDEDLYRTCKEIFDDIVNKKMYITGGVGATRHGEMFSHPYDLKNDKAYAETCAAISLMFFAHRMLRFENDSKYADIIERVLYNGMIAGLSLDGDKFFYENPLEINLKNYIPLSRQWKQETYAATSRVKVFECSCCPPNLNRVLASLGSYIYGYEGKSVYVNQFVGSEADVNGIRVRQITDFPKTNTVKFFADGADELCIRIPQWCDNFEANAEYSVKDGYAVFKSPMGEISVSLDMTPHLIQSNTEVLKNNGCAAVCCGPYVMAAEAIDNVENLHSIRIDKNLNTECEYSEELCGFKLKVKAYIKKTDSALYSRYTEDYEDFTLNMIPYAAYANRGDSNMCVWLGIK